jgi:hypothetical protein
MDYELALPKMTASMDIVIKVPGGEGIDENYVYSGPLPEEVMDAYQKIVGDAKARVTVSADMAIKNYGTGAGAMVSVSLSCNQDEETIDTAIQMAGQLARSYAMEQRSVAEEELNKKMSGNAGTPNYG